MLFATLPAPHQEPTINKIVYHDAIGAVRFNTGVSSSWDPYETIHRLRKKTETRQIPPWIALIGRQMRVLD